MGGKIELSEAMQDAENLREKEMHTGFIANAMLGKLDRIIFPVQPEADRQAGNAWLARLAEFLKTKVDPNKIDMDGDMPDTLIDGFRELTAFGIKIPREYGGLGLSQANYGRAAMLFGSWCGNTSALLSAHNSLGATLPLIKYGTEEQKRRWLPRIAKGAITAFALTEKNAGSDTSRIETYAERQYDDSKSRIIRYRLKGEKIYTTNAVRQDNVPLADMVTVIARTVDHPSEVQQERKNKKFGLFIVEKGQPGYVVGKRCRFAGLRSIFNGETIFNDVQLTPNELVGPDATDAAGGGRDIAFKVLTVGRLTISAICAGAMKQTLRIARWWGNERVQFDAPLHKHEAMGKKILDIAANGLVLDGIARWCCNMIDLHQDIRIESAASKVLGTEMLWDALIDLFLLRGGRAFENYYSLQRRGEVPVGIERSIRDAIINLVFEGANPVMELLVARESMAEYVARGMKFANSAGILDKAVIGLWLLGKYTKGCSPGDWAMRRFGSHIAFMAAETRQMAKAVVRVSAHYQSKLQYKQVVLAEFATRAMNLFEMAIALAQAEINRGRPLSDELTDYFCEQRRERLCPKSFDDWAINGSHRMIYKLAPRIVAGEAAWLEEGIVPVDLPKAF